MRDVGWNILNLLSLHVFVLPMFLALLSLLVGMSTVHYNIGDGYLLLIFWGAVVLT